MFSSLDRVDLVYTGPDGRVRWLQSDHRRPAQIESEAELSLIFALLRLTDPRRDFADGEPPPVLEYRCQHMPPAFLRAVIAAAGAELVVDGPVPFEGVAPDPGLLLRLGLAALADRVTREREVACDLAGLEHLEREQPTRSRDDDEVAYWRAVVQLAAVTGEVLRARVGGDWCLRSGDQAGVFPPMFVTADVTIDVLAAAIDRVEGVDGASLAALVHSSVAR